MRGSKESKKEVIKKGFSLFFEMNSFEIASYHFFYMSKIYSSKMKQRYF